MSSADSEGNTDSPRSRGDSSRASKSSTGPRPSIRKTRVGRNPRKGGKSSSAGKPMAGGPLPDKDFPDPLKSKYNYEEEGKRTELKFIYSDGKTESVTLPKRPSNYWDLQKAIIEHQRDCKKMFSIRNEKKELITSENYSPQDMLYIKEFHTSLNMKNFPLEHVRWEFYDYHAKPEKWFDAMEQRLKIKAAKELEEQRKREQEEREHEEFLKNKNLDINEDLKDI